MTRPQRALKILAAGVVLCLGYTALLVGAADPPKRDPERNPVIVYTKGPMKGEFYSSAALFEQLKVRGRLRVIVGLDFEMVAPHLLSEARARAQADRLAALQDKVLSAIPDLSEEVDITRFQSIPYLTVVVDETQLRALLSDAHVMSIQEDGRYDSYLSESTQVISVDKLWDPSIGLTGKGWTAVILDTGTYHPPMLPEPGTAGSRYVDGACYSTNQFNWWCAWWGSCATSLCKGGAGEVSAFRRVRNARSRNPDYVATVATWPPPWPVTMGHSKAWPRRPISSAYRSLAKLTTFGIVGQIRARASPLLTLIY